PEENRDQGVPARAAVPSVPLETCDAYGRAQAKAPGGLPGVPAPAGSPAAGPALAGQDRSLGPRPGNAAQGPPGPRPVPGAERGRGGRADEPQQGGRGQAPVAGGGPPA